MNVDGRKQRNREKRKMQENNDRQEQKVARRTYYMAHALLTALVVNITWLVDVSIRLLVYLDSKTFLPWFEL